MRNLVPPAVAMRKMRLPKVVAIRQSRQQQAIFSKPGKRGRKAKKGRKTQPPRRLDMPSAGGAAAAGRA